MIARAEQEFGRLDVLHNNAGGSQSLGFDADMVDWEHDYKLNLRAAYLGMKHAAPAMRKVGGGSIISTASTAGIRTLPHIHGYSTFKAGVIKLTESAAQVLGP